MTAQPWHSSGRAESCAFYNTVEWINLRLVCWHLLTLDNLAAAVYLSVYIIILLTQWSRLLLDKLAGSQLVKKFPAFYGNRRFITSFTSVRHLFPLSCARSIQSIPSHPTSWRSILILSSHLHLSLPNYLFISGFPTKTLYTLLLSPILATCTAHLIFLDFTTRTVVGEVYRSLSSSSYIFLHSPVTSSLFDPSILLSTIFSNSLSLLYSLNVSDKI